MTVSLTGPRLALETLTRRMRAIDGHGPLLDADCGISWFGPAGLPASRPGSEASVQALCGLMEVNGRDQGVARRLGLEVASVAAGILAAQGTLAVAIAASRGRSFPVVRTSALEAGLLLLSHYFVVATGLGDAVPGPPLPEAGPPFCSADGRWFEIETLDPEPWRDFWTSLGAGDVDLGQGWTVFRWRYERAACSLPRGLHAAAARYPLAEIRHAAARAGVSLAPLRSYRDVLTEPGIRACQPSVRSLGSAPPHPGPVGSADMRGDPPAADELPLDGLKVVEATSRIQGPFAGMLLRMLGAEVTRVQPPEGDYGRAALCLHRGKAAVTLDLGSAPGRADLRDLAADADVFLHNWRPGKAAEWRLDFDDLAPRHPRLVYANFSGWADRPEGRHLVGTDFLLQAYTGLGLGLNPEDEPAFPSRMILSDLFGALVGTESILTALYRREQDGCAREVRSSLLAGAMSLQAHVLEGIAQGREERRRGGRPLWGPLDRPVPTTDGTLVVTIDDDHALNLLCEACGASPAGASRAGIEQRLATRLGDGAARDWEEMLIGAGIPCAVACDDLAALPADPRFATLFEPVCRSPHPRPDHIGGIAPGAPWSFG